MLLGREQEHIVIVEGIEPSEVLGSTEDRSRRGDEDADAD
jgi:hypothetical protein